MAILVLLILTNLQSLFVSQVFPPFSQWESFPFCIVTYANDAAQGTKIPSEWLIWPFCLIEDVLSRETNKIIIQLTTAIDTTLES